MKDKLNIEITSMWLHIFAMVTMLCDHLWATIIPGNDWLTCLGRLAFPVFAFMIVEGYFKTSNLKKYTLRLFIFALISEIPFNLVMGSSLIYWIHQNILWTFLISIGMIHILEKVKQKNIWLKLLVLVGVLIASIILGVITFCDYNFAGILTVLTFYLFRDNKWWCRIGQLICMWYINCELLGGYEYLIEFMGREWHIQRQSFALLSLIPIWLYNGKQGYYNKYIKALYYWFYPVHLLMLALLK